MQVIIPQMEDISATAVAVQEVANTANDIASSARGNAVASMEEISLSVELLSLMAEY